MSPLRLVTLRNERAYDECYSVLLFRVFCVFRGLFSFLYFQLRLL